jgi:hypothetical protein
MLLGHHLFFSLFDILNTRVLICTKTNALWPLRQSKDQVVSVAYDVIKAMNSRVL